jgi:hypothetical protein
MDSTTNKNKKWWIIFSILLILVLGFLVYKNYDTVKKYFGFATVYDAAGNRAVSSGWTISANSYAWGENVGWVDFAPVEGDTYVADNALWGYAYGESIGWISLNCANSDSCGTVNYKVSNNNEGKLSGYAWGENVGWIDFGTSTDIANRPWGVSITSGGDFTGYAYGENVGWISFNSANGGSVVYKVSTSWRPQSLRPQCNNGLDDDNDGDVDYPDDRNCSSLTDTRERKSNTYVVPTEDDNTALGGGDDVTATTTVSTSTATTTAGQASTPTTTPSIVPPTTLPTNTPIEELFKFTGTFTRDLYVDIRGEDVKELQKFLNNKGFSLGTSGVGSTGNETTYYGNRTADAVTKFQEANSDTILKPLGLTKGTGYLGKLTRGLVNSILNRYS